VTTTRKQPAERIIEAITWASVVIWLGFTLIAHILNYVWLVVMVLSVILLSSAIYQRSRDWETSLSIWVFGIWMAVFAVLETVSEMIAVINGGSGLEIDLWVYLGVALVSMGVAAIFRMVTPSTASQLGISARRPTDYESDRARDYAPRRVDQDLSSAWMPQAQDAVQYGDSRSRRTSRPPAYSSDTDRGSDTRARDVARRADDPFDRAPQFDTGYGEYGEYRDPRAPYDEPMRDAAGYYAEPPPRDSRRARRVDDAPEPGWGARSYDRPTQERPYEGERLSRQRGRGRSQPQRSQRRSRRAAPSQGSDLESRVEDIIKRSRAQRSDTPSSDELPY
jgi:hypothetical protein